MFVFICVMAIIGSALGDEENKPVKPICSDPNAEYTTCGTHCPPTCQIRWPECIKSCKSGCFCKKGYILDHNGKGGRCIPEKSCKGYCPKGQVFDSCGPKNSATCDNRSPISPDVCTDGCYCRRGYILNNEIDQKCIRIRKCPSKCGANQIEGCTGPCDATCQYPIPRPCGAPCTPGCACAKGYVLENSKSKRCIALEDCECACGANEEYKECGTACPTTCKDLFSWRKPYCTKECQEGCFCKRGFVLASESGPCVPIRTCLYQIFFNRN